MMVRQALHRTGERVRSSVRHWAWTKRLARWTRIRYPSVVVEIAPPQVRLLYLDRTDSPARVKAFDERMLPEGSVTDTFMDITIEHAGEVAESLERLFETTGAPREEVSLLLPDHVARILFIDADSLPRSEEDMRDFLHWKLQGKLPYHPRDARLTHRRITSPKTDAPNRLMVAAMHKSQVRQWDEVASALGLHAGLVQTPSMALMQSSATKDAPWLHVYAAPNYYTLAAGSSQRLDLFRTKEPVGKDYMNGFEKQLRASILYYREKLHAPPLEGARVFCTSENAATVLESVRRALTDEGASLPVEAYGLPKDSEISGAGPLPESYRPLLYTALL